MNQRSRAFPGRPVVRTVLSLQGLCLIPTQGTKIPQAAANNNNNQNQIIKNILRVCIENTQKILETQQSEICTIEKWAKDLERLLTKEDIRRSI